MFETEIMKGLESLAMDLKSRGRVEDKVTGVEVRGQEDKVTRVEVRGQGIGKKIHMDTEINKNYERSSVRGISNRTSGAESFKKWDRVTLEFTNHNKKDIWVVNQLYLNKKIFFKKRKKIKQN